MSEAGLQEVDTYISHINNTVTLYIKNMLIMELCLEEERCIGPRLSKR